MDWDDIRETISRTRKYTAMRRLFLFFFPFVRGFFSSSVLLQRYPETFRSLQDRDTWPVVSGVIVTLSLAFYHGVRLLLLAEQKQSIASVGSRKGFGCLAIFTSCL